MNNNEKYQQQFAKRIVSSAGSYFGQSRFIRRKVNLWWSQNGRYPVTGDDLRAALDIKSDKAWIAFVNHIVSDRGFAKGFVASYADATQRDSTSSQPEHIEVTVRLDDGKQQQSQNTSSQSSKHDQAELTNATNRVNDLQRQLAAKAQRENELQAEVDKVLAEKAKAVEAAKIDKPTHLVIENKTTDQKIEMRNVHKTLPALLARLKAGLNVYLVGPAGSGKTTAAESAATALGMKFGFMSVGPQTTKTDILGYMSATGHYVETEFRRRYEHGGVFLFDEIDAGNGGVLTCINAALAGTCAAFPDAMVNRSPTFICIAAGNTYGTGPDRVYVGRNELDGASTDRFSFLEWGYDHALEMHICNAIDATAAAKWVPYVQAARNAVAKLGLRHVVSPRASINGTKLLRDGLQQDEVATTDLWKALKPADVDRVKATMRSAGFANA